MKTLIKQIIGEGNIKRVGRLKGVIGSAFKTEKYSVLLDTTNRCNLKCAFCTKRNDKIAQMTTDQMNTTLGKIVRQINTCSFHVCGGTPQQRTYLNNKDSRQIQDPFTEYLHQRQYIDR